jgi:iron complex outermembrane receptor protein
MNFTGSNHTSLNGISKIASKLMTGTALALLPMSAALAQNETVTVTGTSIRGQQPVGANVITVNRATIEATGAQTTAQLLVTIPQLNNFGSAAQGGENSSDTTVQAPTIHSLGNSASNSTLILIDGHRLPLTGITHNLVDPSVIPTSAIASVEVLPDGASAIYGSDAVAGVLNFHTRKDYSGWETGVQNTFADNYSSFNFSQLFGHSWEGGGVIAAYNYSSRSNLMNRSRDFITTRQDLRRGAADPSLFVGIPGFGGVAPYGGLQTVTPAAGPGIAGMATPGAAVPYPSDGGNFQNLTSCPVATISTTSANSGSVFVYPYVGTTAIPRQTTPSGGPGTGVCDTLGIETALPSETRNQGLVSVRQQLNDKLSMNMDAVYSARFDTDHNARGSVTNVAVFNPAGTGGPAFGTNQRNPFYVGVPGAATNATSQFVSMGFDQLLASQGKGASTKSGDVTIFATLGLDYDAGSDWLLSLGTTFGTDFTFERTSGLLNSPEALLALNGTVNTAGTANTSPGTSAAADVFGLNTVLSVTRALTTANALDVWRPADTNRTSSSVLRSLVDSATNSTSVQNLQNVTLHADGPLMDLWGAGPVKAAVGAEFIHYTQDQTRSRANNTGPNSTSSSFLMITMQRTVYAAFAEFVVPVAGPDMNIPLVRNLVFDFAGRYDHYNDFGDTLNPKISFTWGVIDGIAASASFGTSFTAPALNSMGRSGDGLYLASSINANNSGAANNLVILFNDTRPFNNNAGIAGTFVSNPFSCAAAGSSPVSDAAGNTVVTAASGLAIGCKIVNSGGTGSQGLSRNTGNRDLKPEIGQTYSANLVFDDFGKFWDALEGLSAHFTYYQAKFTGAVTNIGVATTATAQGLPFLTTFGPANCNSAASCALTPPGWSQTDPFIQSFIAGVPLNNPLPARLYSTQSTAQQNAFNLWQNGIDFEINYRMSTEDMGDFSFGLSGNQILRFSQQNGPTGVIFDIKNGQNGGRFAGIELTGRLSLNWSMDPFTLGVAFNYQHPYNTGLTTFPFTFPGPADPGGGITCGINPVPAVTRCANVQHIGAQQTVDVNASYSLPEEWLSGTQFNISVRDLFDSHGPYINNTSGLASGSPIGRQVTVGLRKKW